MKYNVYLIVLLSLVPGIFWALIVNEKSPEQLLVGKWRETSWMYEKLDRDITNEDLWTREINDEVQREIYSHLVIHQAEEWDFYTDQRLNLIAQDHGVEVNWKLKGRGNVLELNYKDGHEPEEYYIQEISNNHLILHFNSDLQVRGIVKMIFTRIE